MSITAKPLIKSKFASASTNLEYQAPTYAIIDKFTATNTSGGAVTLNIYIVPSGQTTAASNLIISALNVASGATADIPQMQNQILAVGDSLYIGASAGSAIVIRASGREVV